MHPFPLPVWSELSTSASLPPNPSEWQPLPMCPTPFFPQARAPWTARVPLPGGNFPVDGVPALTAALMVVYGSPAFAEDAADLSQWTAPESSVSVGVGAQNNDRPQLTLALNECRRLKATLVVADTR